jgi:hypothetical protein
MLPADVPAEYAPAMVSACSEAIAEGSCAMAATLTESTRPDVVALVLWQGEGFLQVTVRVGRGNGQWLQRALAFSDRDSVAERFTTVGLTVATLVGETTPQPQPPEPAPVVGPPTLAAPPSDVAPAPSPPQEKPRSRWLLGQVGVRTASSWRGADWEKGGWLSVGVRLPHLPLVVQGFGGYGVSSGPASPTSESVDTRVIEGGLRAGVTGAWQALNLGAAVLAEVGVRHLAAQGVGSDTEAPVKLRVMGTFPAQGLVGGLLGGALRIPTGTSERSDTHLTRPDLEAELVAGVEVRL